MTRLPRSLDELVGLRAAHWGRESTRRQEDRFGPEAQREQRDVAIRRYGLVDSEIGWLVAHSGRTIGSTTQFAEMLERAGRDYDVLVVGYVSRFARDLRTAVNARHDLHAAGAALLFADERVLSSDEDAWETWAREAVEAEAYSRRLGKRIREGYAAKRRRYADQGGGLVPVGFRRDDRKLVEVDPDTMPYALAVYRLSAAGRTDAQIALEQGISLWRVRGILTNPLYAGRLEDGTPTRFPAPIPLELREASAAMRTARKGSLHSYAKHRTYPLTDRGPLACEDCGRFLKGAYKTDRGVAVYRHPDRCDAWRTAETPADVLERQVAQLLDGAAPNRESAARIRAALARPAAPIDRLELARIDARLRTLALGLVDRADRAVLDEMDALRAQRALVADTPVEADEVDPEDALDWLASLGGLWRATSDEGRRALAQTIFARLGASDRRIVAVEPTAFADRRGLALALPTQVTMVGDTGLRPPLVTARWSIWIAGRADWLRAARARSA